jgi:hypothetical protein
MLLEPTLNKAGEGLRDWFAEKDIIARGADLFGNIGETTRAKVLGGLTDEVAAPSVNIADYKRSAFKPSPHEYGGMTKKVRDAMGYEDEAYFRSAPQATGESADLFPETIAGRDFYVNPNQAGSEQNSVLIPNTLASSVGIDNLERAKYASEIAGWGASSAALGAAALGMNALMRGGRKPRSEYSLAVQDSGGYNPNVEASRASYEYSAKLEELKQRHRRENEWNRQQARVPGVQQYSAPPSGGYGQYPDMNFNAAQMASSIINAPTPMYQ